MLAKISHRFFIFCEVLHHLHMLSLTVPSSPKCHFFNSIDLESSPLFKSLCCLPPFNPNDTCASHMDFIIMRLFLLGCV